MDDTIWRDTDLEDEIMQRQNGIFSYEGLASEILQQTDPSTIQVIRQLFTSPGNGPEFLYQILRFAEVKQMVLPGVEGATDVAVISLQNLRELAKKIHFGYDTTHKYVVVFCALNLVVKARQEGRIQLLFPLKQYAPPPTTQALDKLIKHSRPKVRQFAMRVKQRCILYGIIPESGSPHKELSTSEQQLLQHLYTIMHEEHVEPGKRQRLFQRISSEIISELLTPSTSSSAVLMGTGPVVESQKVIPEASPRLARPLELPERTYTDEPVTSQPDVVTSNRPSASGKNPFAITSIATMDIIQEAKKLIDENQRLLAEDPFAESDPPFSQPEQAAPQLPVEESKPAVQQTANDQPAAPLFDVNKMRIKGKSGRTYSVMDDDDIEGLTETEILGKKAYKRYAIAMADPKTFEKKTKPEVDPKLAEIAARHGKKIVNGEVISIDEFGNEIPKPPKKKAEPEAAMASGQTANAKPAEKSSAGKKSPSQPKPAKPEVSPASKQTNAAKPVIEKSPVEKKSPPVQPEVQQDAQSSEQATVVEQPVGSEKSSEQPTEDTFSSISMIDPKHYSSQFLTTYVTYNVNNFINILYNNNNVNNDRTLRKQLAMFLAELFDGDHNKWKIHMKLLNECDAEAVTGALVYVYSSLYDQGGHTIANKAGLFMARCREYHAEGLDAGVILRVKSFEDKTFEQMIAFFKSKRQQQLEQQEKHKAANRQTYQQGQQVVEEPGAVKRDPRFALETPKESNVILVRQGRNVVYKRYNYGKMVTRKRRGTQEIPEAQEVPKAQTDQ